MNTQVIFSQPLLKASVHKVKSDAARSSVAILQMHVFLYDVPLSCMPWNHLHTMRLLYGARLLYQMWSAPCVRFQKGSSFSIHLLASSSMNMPCITRLAACAQPMNHVLVMILAHTPLCCQCIVQRISRLKCLAMTVLTHQHLPG